MSNRSGVMGKPAGELTVDELKAEKVRCEAWLSGPQHSSNLVKLWRKRLREIEAALISKNNEVDGA